MCDKRFRSITDSAEYRSRKAQRPTAGRTDRTAVSQTGIMIFFSVQPEPERKSARRAGHLVKRGASSEDFLLYGNMPELKVHGNDTNC